MTRMTRIFKAALYIPANHTEGKKNPRHPCHPCLKDYLHAEGEPCSSATLVNYHFPYHFRQTLHRLLYRELLFLSQLLI